MKISYHRIACLIEQIRKHIKQCSGDDQQDMMSEPTPHQITMPPTFPKQPALTRHPYKQSLYQPVHSDRRHNHSSNDDGRIYKPSESFGQVHLLNDQFIESLGNLQHIYTFFIAFFNFCANKRQDQQYMIFIHSIFLLNLKAHNLLKLTRMEKNVSYSSPEITVIELMMESPILEGSLQDPTESPELDW